MNNFFNLCVNENIKLYKKTSTKIFIILLCFTLIISLIIVNYIEEDNFKKNKDISQNINTKTELENTKTELNFINDNDLLNLSYSQEEINSVKAKLYYYQYSVDNNIILDNGQETNYYKYKIIQELIKLRSQLYSTQDDILNEKIDKLVTILNNNDFNGYIEEEKANVNEQYQNNEINENEKDLLNDIYDIEKTYEVSIDNSKSSVWKANALENIKNDKERLLNLDNSNSQDKKENLKDDISLNMYKLKENIAINSDISNVVNYNDAYIDITQSLIVILITIFFIILAGSSISDEFDNGTIKQLFMLPNKKWKILFSKLIVLVINLIFITIISSIFAQLLGNIFFTNNLRSNYLYILNGQVHSMNSVLYIILKFLSCDIEILIYMLFAMMLSVITISTSSSVGIAMFIYFGSIGLTYAINSANKQSWVKYIPFNNFNIVSRLFKNNISIIPDILKYKENPFVNAITLSFSLKYIIICLVIFVTISFYTFNKKISNGGYFND